MSTPVSSADIDDAASAWAAKVDRAPLPATEQLQFQAWLAADVRHQGAYARARAILLTLQPAARAVAGASAENGPRPSRRGLLAVGSGMAAAVAAVSVAAGVEALRGRYATKRGEVRLISLPDGSVMTLNTASEVFVRFNSKIRDIRLTHGEALFDVRKSRAWPFIVRAGDTSVRAVGTSFTVERLAGQPVRVLVREGVVEVAHLGAAGAGVRSVRLAANERALVNNAESVRVEAVDPAVMPEQLSWRQGMLAFRATTLGDAAAQFSRYSDLRIQIDDPSVRREVITGLFSANDPGGFAQAAAASLGLRVETSTHAVRLMR